MSRSKEAHCLRRAHGPAWKSCPQVGTSVVDESLEPSGTHSNIQGSATATVKAEERSKYRTERMAKRLIPLLDRVLVQKIQAPSKSIGGVLLPETASKVCRIPIWYMVAYDTRLREDSRSTGSETRTPQALGMNSR